MRFVRIYAPFTLNTLKQRLAYKFSAFGWALMPLITFFVTYNIWKAVYASAPSDTLAGFTFHQMAVYASVQVAIQRLTESGVGWQIGRDVIRGDIASTLIKPISYTSRLFAEDIGWKIFNMIAVVFPVFVITYAVLGYSFNAASFALFFLSTLLGWLICFFFDLCFGMLAFYVTYVWGLQMAKAAVMRFLTGTMIPLSFFPEAAQTVFRFLPFQYISYTPAMIFLGKYESAEILFVLGVQLAWVGILFVLSKILWAFATKRLTILGG